MDELIEGLGFWIDRSGATAVLREAGGGCHPATRSELALWDALEAARVEVDALRGALKELITWIPSADTYRRLGFNPEAPMRAHEAAKAALSKENKA